MRVKQGVLDFISATTHDFALRCCRVQLPGVGSLAKLTIGLSGAGEQAAWLVEQVEVTDEAKGGRRGFRWIGEPLPCTSSAGCGSVEGH